ncbi:UvrD-helicase domain-containing protein [Vibrio parahaemolyticus]|nr:UvrD-helicase domain-containing protein [Vibrio parahaemolyticus]
MALVTLTTSSLAHFFKKKWQITFDQQGVTIVEKNVRTFFLWNELDRAPALKLTFSGVCLSLTSNARSHHYDMLGYFNPSKLSHQLFVLWSEESAKGLRDFLNDVDERCTSHYIRDSEVANIQLFVESEMKKWRGWEKVEGLSALASKTGTQLTHIHHWTPSDIATLRQRYVEKQLVEYQVFFDTVESNPLTPKQRMACVTDNDNNLLLAGAGTGKTSVMIGRSGYLVKSAQARPEDILLLAYGRIAAREMDERIRDKLGFDEIRASTFHSLGVKIISTVEGRAPSLSKLEGSPRAKAQWMNDEIESLMRNNRYRKALLEYFSAYYYVDKSPWAFESQGAYLKYLRDNDIRSMKGEAVKSYGEMVVANWLYRQGIHYEYEAKYRFDVATLEYRQYEPDFYLPEYDIYIEYYGIDEHGDTVPYVDRERYHKSIQWKRQTHKKYGTGYVEVFYSQHKKGQLENALEDALMRCGVDMTPVADEVLLDGLEKNGQVTELARLLGKLVDMFKAACLDEEGVHRIIKDSIDPKQMKKALELLMPLYHRYETYLKARQEIDFNDMIGKAVEYVETGRFQSPWKYLLVDEFQDISEPRARLVKALRDSSPNTSLFCVGDDWQAIYRFSGADVRLTTEFSSYFGATSETTLDLTFRFNQSIGDVATRFVTQNPVQLKKDIHSFVKTTHPAVSILRQSVQEQGLSSLDKALSAISRLVANSKTPNKNKVYLLARYWHQLPDLHALRTLKHRYPTLHIENQSFHASKGKEAEYVIVMGLTTGKHGFPSEKQIPPLVNALLPQGEAFQYAEERRLFYVALTRAKHKVYLLADMTDVSEFVLELMKDCYSVNLGEFDTSRLQQETEKMMCHQCGVGVMHPKAGQYGHFFSCSLYPRCRSKETPCTTCGSPMTRSFKTGYQVCINTECSEERPICKQCGSEMKMRHSQFGAFWGCSSYRKGMKGSCSYKIDNKPNSAT